ncbi:putative membrane protein [Cupriavidus sp. TA19]|uniref:lysoplasmalogenase n=1 Tax=unclassified Cupriavidus TaxID=2640874 RepID=UPI000E2EC7A0|nr:MULTISPECIES: lysoplasmalogenase [unclassified Cupriavidus]BDB25963.1 lysoplasmalogenase [Cupriavidus sp. P-10]GLC94628.1 putative membrane protein [Cupriavidus sp. TA19]
MSWLAMRMPARVREWWLAGALAGLIYGVLLVQVSMELPEGAPLNGQIAMQPAWKVAMALLLARAAWFHRPLAERRWLVTALVCSAIGDFLLAVPALSFSFVGGLGAFLLAHLAYLRLLVPLAGDLRPHRLIACGALLGVAGTMLGRFWPNLGTLTVPVSLYVGVLAAMACSALVARLPTPLAALGALCFAASDMMIGIARFLVPFETFALGIWWTYAAAQVLLVAGIVSGRSQP